MNKLSLALAFGFALAAVFVIFLFTNLSANAADSIEQNCVNAYAVAVNADQPVVIPVGCE